MRVRLLECKRCQERHWIVDEETPPEEGYDLGMCAHEWLERFTFFAADDEPGGSA